MCACVVFFLVVCVYLVFESVWYVSVCHCICMCLDVFSGRLSVTVGVFMRCVSLCLCDVCFSILSYVCAYAVCISVSLCVCVCVCVCVFVRCASV